ncbi:hypothetical protein ACLKA6_003354 [Drosophila palustris]
MVRTPYYRKGQLTYTEDDVLVKNLFLLTESAKGLEQQQLLKYFGNYGCVERLDLYPSGKKIQTGCVVFANPYDAAKQAPMGIHMKGELAYTEDHVLVRSLFLVNIARKLKQQQLQKYFEEYGCVESLDLYTSQNGTRTGRVAFADPCDAATALRDRFHLVSGCRITARPSYSWRQPDAVKMSHGPENAPIMRLNDYCLEYIFRQLNLPDRIHFARSCFRFRSIYEAMSPLLDKSINFNVFKSMTLWDLHDFFQLSGCNVKKIEGTMPRLHFNHVCSLLGMHCINLQSLIIRNNNYTDLKCNTHIFKTVANLSSLQNLELDGCGLTDDHLQALKHLGHLKKLNLSNNGKLTALQTLIVKWRNAITDRGLEALFTLQDLREIHIKYNWKISENAVRRLILACPKLQVLHLEHCDQLTDKLLQDLILELRNDQFNRPLPIKLYMTGNKVSQFTLQSGDVAAKNIIDAICEG